MSQYFVGLPTILISFYSTHTTLQNEPNFTVTFLHWYPIWPCQIFIIHITEYYGEPRCLWYKRVKWVIFMLIRCDGWKWRHYSFGADIWCLLLVSVMHTYSTCGRPEPTTTMFINKSYYSPSDGSILYNNSTRTANILYDSTKSRLLCLSLHHQSSPIN